MNNKINSVSANCISIFSRNSVSPARFTDPDVQLAKADCLGDNLFTFPPITHNSIYRLICCGQSTGDGKPIIQQQILFLVKLTGICKNLREIIKRFCLAMSNQSLDENASDIKQRKELHYVWSGKLLFLEKTSGITACLSRVFLSHMRHIAISFMPTFF